MKRRYRLRLAAVEELDRQAAYIGRSSPRAAVRFLQAAEQTFQYLADHPKFGIRTRFTEPRAAEILVWRIKRFPNHLVLFRRHADRVEILRVVHGGSDWLSQIADLG